MNPVRRRAIATMGLGPMEPVLSQCLRTMLPYAARHGYEVVIGGDASEGRPPAWGKVRILQRLLGMYDEVLWIDADVVIVDSSEDLADHVPPDAYQAMVEMRLADKRHPNAGVWLLRADGRTEAFLDAVWNSITFRDHHWWENAAVMDLFGYELHPGRGPIRDSEWLAGVHWLSQEWNMLVTSHGLRECRFRHYAALPNGQRVRWMRADAHWVEASRHGWTLRLRCRYWAGAAVRWFEMRAPRSWDDFVGKLKHELRRRG